MNLPELIAHLARHEAVKLILRNGPPAADIGLETPEIQVGDEFRPLPPKAAGIEVPPGLREFRLRVVEASLFAVPPGVVQVPNGWEIRTDLWLYDTINERLTPSDPDEGYLRHVYVLAESPGANGVIGVDTHPERFGWIGFYWYQLNLTDGGYPVVAHSFGEWLERTLAAGPDAVYWETEEFEDLGPALPGDECYRPPNE